MGPERSQACDLLCGEVAVADDACDEFMCDGCSCCEQISPCSAGEQWEGVSGEEQLDSCPERRRIEEDLAALIDESDFAPSVSAEAMSEERVRDGAGLKSNGSWTLPRCASDFFCSLRDRWLGRFSDWDLRERCKRHVEEKLESCLFSDEELDTLRRDLETFLWALGLERSAGVEPFQPFHLDLLEGLLRVLNDPDCGLPLLLKEGVPTGVLSKIESSGMACVSWANRTLGIAAPVLEGWVSLLTVTSASVLFCFLTQLRYLSSGCGERWHCGRVVRRCAAVGWGLEQRRREPSGSPSLGGEGRGRWVSRAMVRFTA